jgi:hypothetical protein
LIEKKNSNKTEAYYDAYFASYADQDNKLLAVKKYLKQEYRRKLG